MKITIFTEVYYPKVGGMERYAEDMAVYWSQHGIDVCVVTDTVATADIQVKDNNFSVKRSVSFWNKVSLIRASDEIFFVGVTFENILAAYFSLRKIFISHHGVYVYKNEYIQRIKGAVKILLSMQMYNISVSEFVKNTIGGKHKVIKNGYRDDYFFNQDIVKKKNSFVYCGRLVTDKGVSMLLEAFAKVMDIYPDANLEVIGSGESMSDLINQVKAMGLSCNIKFLGSQTIDQCAKIMSNSECMVVPSIWEEPFGIVVLEGLASGCEVIVTNRGGLPEALDGNGFIVEPTVVDIEKAMLGVCSGSKKYDRKTVESYLLERRAKQVALEYLNYITDKKKLL